MLYFGHNYGAKGSPKIDRKTIKCVTMPPMGQSRERFRRKCANLSNSGPSPTLNIELERERVFIFQEVAMFRKRLQNGTET